DNAGNVEAFGTRVVRLDTLPPNTTLSYTTAWAPNFVVSATVFTLGGSDNAGGSGLALRYYDINGTGWTAGDSFDLTSWSNGSITLRYYSIDNAGNVELAGLRVVLIDTIAPDAPAATSTTHIASTWSSVNVVTVNWSAPGDGNGSGIAGYACSWSRGTGDPGTTITHVGLTATSPMLADANDWHFNIRAIDGVGLASPSVSIGPFFVDVTPPDAPLVSSSTHTIGVPSMVNIINVSWVAPGDGSGSGIAGYSYSWTRGIQGVDNSSDTTALSVVSTELDPASDYYFNMRAIDVVGHGSVVAHLGPFWVTGSSLIPTAMGPADQTIVQNSGDVILSWTFFDPYGIGGHYRILLDGTPATNWSTWTTGVQVNFTIHATVLGIRNYTAEYNNTLGYSGRDTVIVKIVEPAPPFDLTLVMIVAGAAAVSVATIAVASSKKRSRAKKAKDKGHGEPAMKVPAKGKVAPTAAVPVVGKLPGKGAAAVADPYSVAPLTETDRAELEKTEKEVRTFETQHICVVHKGPIAGAIFLCPKCKVFYCMNCARVLKQKGEKCWSCGEDIAIDIPPTEAGESAGHGGVDAPPPKPVAGPDDKAKDAPDRGGPVDSPQP
ncbi:MAG: fibronectin type III domain-containing protein, partial [Candidatus Lokiarchaeota archaeon]|nr:fibronectin type III domain-containing protein [Candidatus Lokiarchaeota archaeon]